MSDQDITENRGKAKSSAVKSQDKLERIVNEAESSNTALGGNSVTTIKKRRKPGPKPKPKLNTKKLKTVLNKAKAGIAKTPNATAQRGEAEICQ